MPKWLREIVSDLRAIAATGMVFVAASVVGFFVAVKLASGQPWIGIIAAVGFLVLIALPLRLWWTLWRRP